MANANIGLAVAFFAADDTPADQPGTLVHGATSRRGGGITLATSVSDPDGIRSIDSATLNSRDGRSSDISSGWTRRDANTFVHPDTRTNNRWRTASMSVTYTDGNGVQSTLTAMWSL